jgi:HNH endonuclease
MTEDLYIDPPPFSYKEISKSFRYDPVIGAVYWNRDYGSRERFRRGDEAGTPRNGYIFVKLGYKAVQAHRIAWFLFYGKWPREMDHINADGMDNRLSNLQVVTHAENNRRSGARRSGRTWSPYDQTWSQYHE